MSRYLKLVIVWLAFGVGLGVVVLVISSAVLGPPPIGPDHPHDQLQRVLRYGGVGWFSFGLAVAAMSMALQSTRFFVKSVEWFTKGVNGAMFIVILGSILLLFFDIVPGFNVLRPVEFLNAIFGPSLENMGNAVGHLGLPRMFQEVRIAPVFMVLALVFVRNGMTWGLNELGGGETASGGQALPDPRRRQRRDRDEAREERAKAATRRVAVASYVEAKALLAGTQMDLTFLALDIIASTKIKQGEDAYVVEQSFSDYRKLVERMLLRHDAYKQTWTPDGQMAAFMSPQSAVACGRDILLALPEFNENQSQIAGDFKLRVGANSGIVSSDEEVPLEEMSDFTIDVAGHMQKYADPDSIWISEAVFESLTDSTDFTPNGEEVDGRAVYVWKRDS